MLTFHWARVAVSPNAAKKNAPAARRQAVFRVRLRGFSGF